MFTSPQGIKPDAFSELGDTCCRCWKATNTHIHSKETKFKRTPHVFISFYIHFLPICSQSILDSTLRRSEKQSRASIADSALFCALFYLGRASHAWRIISRSCSRCESSWYKPMIKRDMALSGPICG